MKPVFFTDRDLGKSFPQILREAGLHVEQHADHFADDATDEEWLTEIGKREWVAITHDKRIRYKPNQRNAVMRANVGLFILSGKATTGELAKNFINTIDRITNFIEHHERPFIAKIYRPAKSKLKTRPDCPGEIKLWLSKKEWLLQQL